MNRLVLTVVLALGAWACGDDERAEPLPSGDGGRSSVPTAGSTGSPGGAGGAADAGATGEGPGSEAGSGGEPGPAPVGASPLVTITSPETVTDPSNDGVLSDHKLEVLCVVRAAQTPGAAPVDPSSVRIGLFDASGTSVTEADGISSGKAGEYSAVLIVPEIESGPVTVRCSANDSAAQPHVGVDTVETFFDAGPVITIGEPARDSPHPLRGAIGVEFVVDPSPLAEPDPGAAVESVSLVVQGETIATTAAGNVYTASLDLNDKGKFPVTPTDRVPVGIKATNRRGVERRQDYTFRIDSSGPEIVFRAPTERSVVGGQIPIIFEVTDDRIGVNPDSVAVFINQEEHRYDGSASWSVTGSEYTFRYDWAQLSPALSQVTVNVRASDLADNAAPGASLELHLDNIPPYISLDPPNVRELRLSGGARECSPPFDPLFAAANDQGGLRGDESDPFLDAHVLLRAFVVERTNEARGQTHSFYSGVDTSSVRLYLQPDPDVALLTDARGNDGLCDDIVGIDDLHLIQLVPLDAAGQMVGGPRNPEQAPVIDAEDCVDATPNDDALCDGESDMTRILYDERLDQPMVFAVAPADELSDLTCSGISAQIRPNFTEREGWVCVAAVVEDAVGNRDVSEPLRLCLSNDDPSKCPLDELPSCTNDCDPTFYDPYAPELPWQIPVMRLR